jgi:hypothetical protein
MTFDTTSVNANAKGFLGGSFDGRYISLVPGAYDGVVARYDTRATFTAAASWTTFGITSVNANATGFYGAAFDGRYLYFVPNGTGASGVTARSTPSAPEFQLNVASAFKDRSNAAERGSRRKCRTMRDSNEHSRSSSTGIDGWRTKEWR